MLSGEARRAASILHQTPRWRWTRQLCLTERYAAAPEWAHLHQGVVPRLMQSSGQRRLPARQRRDACKRHRQSTCEEQRQRTERNACRQGNVETRAWHRLGTCRKHCQRSCMERVARAGGTARTRSTRVWTALFQRTWQTTELQRQETRGQHRLGTRRWQRQS